MQRFKSFPEVQKELRVGAQLLRKLLRNGEILAIKTTLAATAVIALAAPAAAQGAAPAGAQEAAEQQLGNVHFATSCNEVAQRRFDRAMRYQHSFWYRESQAIFEDVLKADPQCAIALWGVALSMLNNPHAPPPNENLPRGLAALQKAKEIGAKTPRERDFIDALLAFYTDSDKIDHRTRVQSYLKAMEAVAQRYPDDDEAQIFYAITLNDAAAPTDKTYANQLKGAAILEPIFRRQPTHPGVAHYLIHLYDYPPIAEKGLDAATRYSKIAPSAPHAQHMPSHIFTRVGYWKESIASNAASVRAAKADKAASDQLHGQERKYQVDETNHDLLHQLILDVHSCFFKNDRRVEEDRIGTGDLLKYSDRNSERDKREYSRLQKVGKVSFYSRLRASLNFLYLEIDIGGRNFCEYGFCFFNLAFAEQPPRTFRYEESKDGGDVWA